MDEKVRNAVPQKVEDSNPGVVKAIITALVKPTPWYVTDAWAREKLAPLENLLKVAYGKNSELITELAPKIKEICKDKKMGKALLNSLGEVGERFKGVDTENAANMLLQVLSDMRNAQGEKGFTQHNIIYIAEYMKNNYDYNEMAQTLTPVTKVALQRQPR